MAWIESHQSLLNHRKTGRLARKLGISKITAIGHLHAFWWWCMDNAQDGDLTSIDAEDIADGSGWEGEPVAFIDALIYAGFVDGDAAEPPRRIHDWHEYVGKLIEKREKDAERKRLARLAEHQGPSHEPPKPVRRTSSGRAKDGAGTVPNRTLPNLTKPENVSHETLAAADPPRPAAPSDRPVRSVPKPKDEPHRPNPIWDALVQGVGVAPTTNAERSKYGLVARELRDLGATADDVLRRCANYRQRWPTVDLTPTALLEHWSRMDSPPALQPRASPGDELDSRFGQRAANGLRALHRVMGDTNAS